MKLFTAEQIRKWDAYTITHQEIASIDLMERASSNCYNWITSNIQDLYEKEIKIFCAKGNNGGDGLAIARMLLNNGYKVKAFILEYGNKGTDDFQINLQRLHAITTAIEFIQSKDFFPTLKKEDIIIDAIFGTGLNKPIEGFTAELVDHIDRSDGTVISIDIPSGMFAEKSCKGLHVIKATYTLSFQALKICFLIPENEEAVGEVHLLNIGLDSNFNQEEQTHFHLSDIQLIKEIYRPRKKFAHKGMFGHALIIAGSYGKIGAAVLAAKACLRSGTGLLTVQAPEVGYSIIQIAVPEAMVKTDEVIDQKTYNSIGIGPGFGTNGDAQNIVTTTITVCDKNKTKLIIDADALNFISIQQELLSQLPSYSILTPHPKEFDRLFGKSANDFARMEKALKKAAQYNCYIILKGHHSFVACPDGSGYFNSTGNPGMATAGSGDVLTGILTGLSAQGYTAKEACLLGTFIHGSAGDIAAKKISPESMIAGDIITYLGNAFKNIL
ncbi:MAG: NAD(P)H-hydrate dehydratase [Bacteroidota bacterium]